jgi:hypothetical protein
MTPDPWTHPWAYARPLTVGERLRVLKDWPALDRWGLHAVGVQVQGDFNKAVDRIVADLDPWPTWSNATHHDSPLAVAAGRRGRPAYYGHR